MRDAAEQGGAVFQQAFYFAAQLVEFPRQVCQFPGAVFRQGQRMRPLAQPLYAPGQGFQGPGDAPNHQQGGQQDKKAGAQKNTDNGAGRFCTDMVMVYSQVQRFAGNWQDGPVQIRCFIRLVDMQGLAQAGAQCFFQKQHVRRMQQQRLQGSLWRCCLQYQVVTAAQFFLEVLACGCEQLGPGSGRQHHESGQIPCALPGHGQQHVVQYHESREQDEDKQCTRNRQTGAGEQGVGKAHDSGF